MEFVKLLRERGAKVFVTDINKDLVQRAVDDYGAEAVGPGRDLRRRHADVYSPCALGGTVNEQHAAAPEVPRSSAAPPTTSWPTTRSATKCETRGILYAPDYAVNAGGVMNVSLEIDGYNRERAMRMMRTIYHNLGRIFEIAERDDIPTYKAADRMAEERISAIGKLKLPMGRTAPRFLGRMRGH